MKSLNKKIFIILIVFLNSYAQNGMHKLFFNLPLESSRDTIYTAIKKYGFIEKNATGVIVQEDKIIKTFSGYLDAKILENTLTDSVAIELTTGSISERNEKYYQNLLIMSVSHHFSNVKRAKEFYQRKKNEIKEILSQEGYHFYNYFDDSSITNGYTDTFKEEKSYREIVIEFKRKRAEYIVILSYQRDEGEKKLEKRFLPKKELIVREIDLKKVFNFSNVEQTPVTLKCLVKKDSSTECFKNSILNHILENVDFEKFSLPTETQRIRINFIIDKEAKIININVLHTNDKLCEEIKNSINEINISEPAINNGLKVDCKVEIPLYFTKRK